MRLTNIAKAFDDPDYVFELKHDGFRAIAYIEAGECKLVSRNLNHFKTNSRLYRPHRGWNVQHGVPDPQIGQPLL
jgi:bifunctional non-homologous end joining protein LigD